MRLLIQSGLMRNSDRPGFPDFCRYGQRNTSLEEFDREVDGVAHHFYLSLICTRLTGQMLSDVVQRKGATAGSLDGWGWRELKALPLS